MSMVDALLAEAASTRRGKRSPNYLEGVRAVLAHYLEGAPLDVAYPKGTPQADAFEFGMSEGHAIWRQWSEKFNPVYEPTPSGPVHYSPKFLWAGISRMMSDLLVGLDKGSVEIQDRDHPTVDGGVTREWFVYERTSRKKSPVFRFSFPRSCCLPLISFGLMAYGPASDPDGIPVEITPLGRKVVDYARESGLI